MTFGSDAWPCVTGNPSPNYTVAEPCGWSRSPGLARGVPVTVVRSVRGPSILHLVWHAFVLARCSARKYGLPLRVDPGTPGIPGGTPGTPWGPRIYPGTWGAPGATINIWVFHDFGAGRKSPIFGVWAAPRARETIQKYGGAKPPIFLNGFGGPRGRPNPEQISDFRPSRK